MSNKNKAILMAVYAIVVIASGIYRIVSSEGGTTGLYFGLVMGGIAAAGSLLFWLDKPLLANFDSFLSVAFVGGWFCYESFVKKGFANAEPRQLIVIVITLVVLVLLLIPQKPTEKQEVE